MLDIALAPRTLLDAAADPQAPHSIALLVDTAFAEAPAFRALDARLGGALTRAARVGRFLGKAREICSVLAPVDGIDAVILAGCGQAGRVDAPAVEAAGAKALRVAPQASELLIAGDGSAAPLVLRAGFGALLGAYRFTRYHGKATEDGATAVSRRVRILVDDPEAVRAEWTAAEALARGVITARDLVNEPPNVLTPGEFSDRIETLGTLGVEVEVLDVAAMTRLGFGALLGVAQGSANAPRTVIMRYRGAGASGAPLAFVGKGVTFDSGGLSLKTASGMEEMKTDMAGAAAVVGAMTALAAAKAPVDVIGIVGLVENMVSSRSQRPGDVVRSHSGQTIEVLNTDAEGRLVLADLLSYTRERFSPALMVDLATLTGAIVVSLGAHHAGLFSNDDALADDLLVCGRETGEALWRMPMGEAYDRALRSPIADMKNIGGRPGGAITAARFLARFVGDTPWAHLDIAGTAWASEQQALSPKGATGFGVRLLDALARARTRA